MAEMIDLQARIQDAYAKQQSGELADAERMYLALLTDFPGQVDVCGLLGALYLETGRFSQAENFLESCIASGKANLAAYINLCNLYVFSGNLDKASELFDLLEAKGATTDVVMELKIRTAFGRGHWEECAELCGNQMEAGKQTAFIVQFFAQCLAQLGRLQEAIQHLERLSESAPHNIEVLLQLADLYGKFVKPVAMKAVLDRLGGDVEDNPKVIQLWINHASMIGEDDAVEKYLRKGLAQYPEMPTFRIGAISFFIRRGLHFDAARSLFFLEDLIPEGVREVLYFYLLLNLRAYNAASRLLSNYEFFEASEELRLRLAYDRGDFAMAAAGYQRLDIVKTVREFRIHVAFAAFLSGDYKAGWDLYEARKVESYRQVVAEEMRGVPDWSGEPIDGKKIYVSGEQGLGDTIQFLRYLPALAARTKYLEVEMGGHSTLLTLFNLDNAESLPQPAAVSDRAFDFKLPLMSLPKALGMECEYLSDLVPYLHPNAEPTAVLVERLKNLGDGLKVGLIWAGNPKHSNDMNRSISIDLLDCFADIAGIQWFGLQVGQFAQQPDAAASRLRVEPLGDCLQSVGDTAWALSKLDLLISVDSFPAHLAGALGKEVWVLLSKLPDWRWAIEDGERTRWYPQMRLFRQDIDGDWSTPIQRMAAALRDRVGTADINDAQRSLLRGAIEVKHLPLLSTHDDVVAWPMMCHQAIKPVELTQYWAVDRVQGYEAYCDAVAGLIPDAAKLPAQHHALERMIVDELLHQQPADVVLQWLETRLDVAPLLAHKNWISRIFIKHGNLRDGVDAYARASEMIVELRKHAPKQLSLLLDGCVLCGVVRDKAAAASWSEGAVRNSPYSGAAWYHFFRALLRYGYVRLVEDLLVDFEELLAQEPNYGYVRYALALLKGDEAEAAAWMDHPSIVDAELKAEIISHLDDPDKVEEMLQELIDAHPDKPDLPKRLGWYRLARYGRVSDWDAYEGRHNPKKFRGSDQLALWNGEPLNRRRLLVVAEQGYGDQIYFAKCLQGLPKESIYFAPEKDLQGLMRPLCREIVDHEAYKEGKLDFSQYDFLLPIGSLPRLVGYAPKVAPPGDSYLVAEAERVARWQEAFSAFSGLKVGLAWAGNFHYMRDEFRSMRLKQLSSLADVDGVTFFSLQKDEPSREIRFIPNGLRVLDLATDLNDFSETAAVLCSLDLLITVDTALAHLAGALGVPVWMMIPKHNDWRWGLEGETCDWYPSMRIFRQKVQGDWKPVIEAVKAALTERAQAALATKH